VRGCGGQYRIVSDGSIWCRVIRLIDVDMQAKLDAELELHSRKSIMYTVIRPGGLTDEPAKGCEMGVTQLKKTRYVRCLAPNAVYPSYFPLSFLVHPPCRALGVLSCLSSGIRVDILVLDAGMAP
jgi:hypothetical protein